MGRSCGDLRSCPRAGQRSQEELEQAARALGGQRMTCQAWAVVTVGLDVSRAEGCVGLES